MDCIDLKALLTACSAENPSGEDLEYDPLFGEMERAAKRREEQQFGETVIAAEEPNWSALKSNALVVLERSKDLRAAIQLTRALIRTDGYAGLAAGLSLIRGYLEDYWESLFPRLDPDDGNDPAIRINTLLNLCDPVEFLLPVSRLPLILSPRMGAFSLRDIQLAGGSAAPGESERSAFTLDQIDAAFREAEPSGIRSAVASIEQAIAAIAGISHALKARVGPERSTDLQPLLGQLSAAARELNGRSLPGDPAGVAAGSMTMDVNTAGVNGEVDGASAAINSREDVIRSLDRICRYYAQREPSSPVPLLLQRARRLVTLGFREIVRDLAPDGQTHFDFLWRQEDG